MDTNNAKYNKVFFLLFTGRYVRVCAVVNPPVCRLSSVTFVRPIQPAEIFGNVSMPFLYLSHQLTSIQNFTEIVPGKLLRRGPKTQEG